MEMVLKLDVHDDDKCKRLAIKTVSKVPGIDSISMDMKEHKMTLIGSMDPIAVVKKLRKVFHAEVLTVGPVKQPDKKKEEAQIPKYKPFEYYNYNYYPSYPRYPSHFLVEATTSTW